MSAIRDREKEGEPPNKTHSCPISGKSENLWGGRAVLKGRESNFRRIQVYEPEGKEKADAESLCRVQEIG